MRENLCKTNSANQHLLLCTVNSAEHLQQGSPRQLPNSCILIQYLYKAPFLPHVGPTTCGRSERDERCSDRQLLLQTDLWDLMNMWYRWGRVIAKTNMDNKVVVTALVIFLCEDWGTRVHAWMHLAVAPCRAKKDCTTHHQKVLLKADTSSDEENTLWWLLA